ncbi:hypothetical protein ACJ41O_009138 [Fusarium nematophilum]
MESDGNTRMDESVSCPPPPPPPPPPPSPTRFELLPPALDDPAEFCAWATSFLKRIANIRATYLTASPSIDGYRNQVAAQMAELGSLLRCVSRCILKLRRLDEPLLLAQYEANLVDVIHEMNWLDKHWDTVNRQNGQRVLPTGYFPLVRKRKDRERESLADVSLGASLEDGQMIEEIGRETKRYGYCEE